MPRFFFLAVLITKFLSHPFFPTTCVTLQPATCHRLRLPCPSDIRRYQPSPLHSFERVKLLYLYSLQMLTVQPNSQVVQLPVPPWCVISSFFCLRVRIVQSSLPTAFPSLSMVFLLENPPFFLLLPSHFSKPQCSCHRQLLLFGTTPASVHASRHALLQRFYARPTLYLLVYALSTSFLFFPSATLPLFSHPLLSRFIGPHCLLCLLRRAAVISSQSLTIFPAPSNTHRNPFSSLPRQTCTSEHRYLFPPPPRPSFARFTFFFSSSNRFGPSMFAHALDLFLLSLPTELCVVKYPLRLDSLLLFARTQYFPCHKCPSVGAVTPSTNTTLRFPLFFLSFFFPLPPPFFFLI